MSVRAQQAVWDAGRAIDGTLLIALLALADWADDDGNVIYRRATIARLADRIRRSTRQTQRVLRQLATGGWLTITHRQGYRSIYCVRIDVLRALRGDVKNPNPHVCASPDTINVTPAPDTLDVAPAPDTAVMCGVTPSVSPHIRDIPYHTTTTTTLPASSDRTGDTRNDGGVQGLIIPSILSAQERTQLPSVLRIVSIDLHQALLDELAGAVADGRVIPNRLGWLRATALRWVADEPTPERGLRIAAARSSAAERDRNHNRARVLELARTVAHFRALGLPELARKELAELTLLAPHHPLLTSSTATPGSPR